MKSNKRKKNELKDIVKKKYGSIAKTGGFCCGSGSSCCSPEVLSEKAGYDRDELENIPGESNLGLGCGNPAASAELKKGEVVLDLGSGAGIDCFLAADKVGPAGKVIGVDMTPEMLEKARENAREGGYDNVEFKLGDIENLPVEDSSVDAVISNCVINLSTDKPQVFREIFRVLKSAGRFIISDIVLHKELPAEIKKSAEYYAGCVAGAMLKKDYIAGIKSAGFRKMEILEEKEYDFEIPGKKPRKEQLTMGIISMKVTGTK
jgi:ubiquinone/menaquinone biosynthesis C-methylase UbiE